MTTQEFGTGTQRDLAVSQFTNTGIFWIAVSLVGMIAFYWTGLVSLLDAWARPEYSHGYLIPVIAGYLFVSRAYEVDANGPGQVSGRGPGIALIAAGLTVGLLGNLVQIPDISTYGFIMNVAGLVLLTMGWRRGLLFWAPVFYLIFMLPLPNFIYWPLSIKLQMISSQIGVGIISFFGVPVFLDGNVIDLGIYKLQVAEACNGLRYLFPLMSFGFLFSVLYKGPIWHKVLLVVSTIPITVLMNCFRIGVIGLLVNSYGIEQAEGFLHFFEGWIIFVACIAVLYLEAVLLQRLLKNRQSVHTMLEIDFPALTEKALGMRTLAGSKPLVFASLAIVAAGIAWHLTPARAAVAPQRTPLALFPMEFAGWTGKQEQLDATIERVLAADDYMIADFSNSAATAPVNMFVAYYRSQTEGSGIHSPEVCIPAGGWEVSKWTSADTGLQLSSGNSLTVNRAIIQKGLQRQLVYYWFEQRGRRLTSDYAAKAYTVLDSMSRGRTDGALVRVVTSIGEKEQISAADERLKGFLGVAMKKLPDYVPE